MGGANRNQSRQRFLSDLHAAPKETMTAVQDTPLARKLSAFVTLSQAELAVLERLHERRRTFVAGRFV